VKCDAMQGNLDKPNYSEQILKTLKEIYKIELDEWQSEVFNAEERNLIICSGRQVGKTTTIGAKVVKFAAENAKSKILIVSRTQKQSGYLFEMVKHLLIDCRIGLDGEPTQTRAILKNGSMIYSLPSGWTGAGLRFLTANLLVLEEAAYIPDEVYTTIRPMIATTAGQTIMFSTPNGPAGFFFQCYHDKSFRRWLVPSTECKRIPYEFLKEEKRRMTKIEFEREYEGKFTHVQDGLIDIDLIHQQMRKYECNPHNIHFLGVDVARFGKADSVIAYCEWNREKHKAHICNVDIIRGKKRTTHLIGHILNTVKNKGLNIKKIIVDETGVGGGPVDALVEQLGKRMIIGVNNASRSIDKTSEGRRRRFIKEDLYSNLIRMLEKETLTLDDDINILRSLRNVRFEYTTLGHLKIFGPDSDIAEAIVRAVFPFVYKGDPKRISISALEHSNYTKEKVDETLYFKDNIVYNVE
jgi:phage terminase large subunit-like protein